MTFASLNIVGLDPVFRRNNLGPGIDRPEPFAVVGIDETKLQFCHSRQLTPRFLNLPGIEAGNLDQDPICSDRADNRLAASEVIHAFPDDFDRLVEHSFSECPILTFQSNEERSAAFDVEPESHFLLHRPDAPKTKDDQQRDERGGEQPLAQPEVGGEVPAKEDQQAEPHEEFKNGIHFLLAFRRVRLCDRSDRGFFHFELHIIRDFYSHSRVFDVGDHSVNPRGGHHPVSGFQGRNQALLFLLPSHLWPKQNEIHNDKDQNDGDERSERIGTGPRGCCRLGLCEKDK